MADKRVLLVIMPYFRNFTFLETTAGLAFIAETLKANGIEHQVMDMNLGYTAQDLERKCREMQPDIVGCSMFSLLYLHHYRLMEVIRRAVPAAMIVGGGPHFATFRDKALHDCASLDIVVPNEGEEIFLELARGKAPSEIEGVFYREDGEVKGTGDRGFIQELDKLPWPTYSGFELEKFRQFTIHKEWKISVISSRGCPYRCNYCDAPYVAGRKFRYRSSQNVVDELEYWYHTKGVRVFSFLDDNFTFNRQRVFDICDDIEKRGLKGLQMSCDNGLRADRTDLEMMKRMREVGFWRFGIGVEGGNDKTLRALKKGEKMEHIDECIKNATDLGYSVLMYFVVHAPGQTPEDIEDAVKFAKKYPVDEATFNNIVPYPGTDLYDWLKENGYLVKDYPEYLNDDPRHLRKPLFRTDTMTLEEREKSLEHLFKVEDEVLRKSMARRLGRLGVLGKFMAYFYAIDPVRDFVMYNQTFRKFVLLPIKRTVRGTFATARA